MSVIVSGNPLSVSVSANPDQLCLGENSTLNANAQGGNGNYNYSWTSIPQGFTSSEQSPVITPSVSTTYYVTVSDGQSNVSGYILVTVHEEIITTVTFSNDTTYYGDTLTITAHSNVNATYLWLPYNLTGNSISINQKYYEIGYNTVYLTSTDDYQCNIIDTIIYYIKDNSGIEQKETTIAVHPNPFSDMITIELPIPSEITIYNMSGQKVYQSDDKISGEFELDTTSWKAGMYFIKTENCYNKIIKVKR